MGWYQGESPDSIWLLASPTRRQPDVIYGAVMVCPECARLLADYRRLDQAYGVAFDAMLAASKVPASDFIKVRIVADEARIESELAWLDLEHHQRIHYEAT